MSDPVSWLLVEPGWKVVASEGSEVGKVDEVVGDLHGTSEEERPAKAWARTARTPACSA